MATFTTLIHSPALTALPSRPSSPPSVFSPCRSLRPTCEAASRIWRAAAALTWGCRCTLSLLRVYPAWRLFPFSATSISSHHLLYGVVFLDQPRLRPARLLSPPPQPHPPDLFLLIELSPQNSNHRGTEPRRRLKNHIPLCASVSLWWNSKYRPAAFFPSLHYPLPSSYRVPTNMKTNGAKPKLRQSATLPDPSRVEP